LSPLPHRYANRPKQKIKCAWESPIKNKKCWGQRNKIHNRERSVQDIQLRNKVYGGARCLRYQQYWRIIRVIEGIWVRWILAEWIKV
jgi:hypothetical protein